MGATEPIPCASGSTSAEASDVCASTENATKVPVGWVLLPLAVFFVLIHACIFIKHTKKADPGLRQNGALQWAIAALVLGPFAWFVWRCCQQKKRSQLNSQQLLSDYDGQKGFERDDLSLI